MLVNTIKENRHIDRMHSIHNTLSQTIVNMPDANAFIVGVYLNQFFLFLSGFFSLRMGAQKKKEKKIFERNDSYCVQASLAAHGLLNMNATICLDVRKV